MSNRHSWMKWGSEQITPEDIDAVVAKVSSVKALSKWRKDWEGLNEKLESGDIPPELFSKAVTAAIFPLYYIAEATTKKTHGLYTVTSSVAAKKPLKMTTFEVMTKALDEIINNFSKTSYKAFKSAINGSGERGVLSDGPKESLSASVPALDHVRLGAGRSSDRLWFSQSGHVMYAVSGHIDTSKNGKAEHDRLVKKVNALGGGKSTVALCDLPDFEGELFYVE